MFFNAFLYMQLQVRKYLAKGVMGYVVDALNA